MAHGRKNPSAISLFMKGSWGIALVLALFSSPFWGIGGHGIYQEIQLSNNGINVSSVIVEKWIREGDESDSYHAAFEFTDDTGRNIEGEASISSDTFRQVEIGSRMPIVFEKGNSSNSRLVGESDLVFMSIFFVAGFSLLLFSLSLLIKAFLRACMKSRLFKKGTLTKAEIYNIKDTNVEVNGVPQMKIQYRFKDSVGTVKNGETSSISIKRTKKHPRGEEIEVLYDQSNPDINFWIDE